LYKPTFSNKVTHGKDKFISILIEHDAVKEREGVELSLLWFLSLGLDGSKGPASYLGYFTSWYLQQSRLGDLQNQSGRFVEENTSYPCFEVGLLILCLPNELSTVT
jgi:hypothetical protein